MKGILFDLDGTLLDTIPDIQACCNDVLAAFGLPSISREQAQRFVGNGAKKLVERMLFDRQDLFDAVYARYLACFPSYTDRTALFPEERETLLALKAKGVRLGIITNKPQAAAQRVCQTYLKEFCFDVVQGQIPNYGVKPDPALSELVIRNMGLSKQDCLFVGDGETDLATARALGIPCISVLWGYRSESELRQAGADCLISHFSQLLQFV